MKLSLRFLLGQLLLWTLALPIVAQQQPVVSVQINHLSVQAGPGFVSRIQVTTGGSGYTTPPVVTLTGGEGFGASAVAELTGGSVTAITIQNPGAGYLAPPRVNIIGGNGTGPGGAGAAAIAEIAFPTTEFNEPNEAFGPSGQFVIISALATGTSPAAGFTYSFYVNGTSIGTSINNIGSFPTPGRVRWTPPAPGAYFFHVTANDGITTVTSLPIRFFATGAIILSPQSPTLVPAGSSVVLKGDATTAQGFIRQIEFFVDGASQGVDTTAPYSLIYTPPLTPGVHNVTAMATDNSGVTLATTNPVVLTVVPAIGSIPLVSVASPASSSALRIPDYTTSSASAIPVSIVASDGDGTIIKVETYIDGVLVSTDQQFPYSYNWQPQSIGTYRIVALAFDDKNNVVASNPSVVTVSAPPTVNISRPSNNAALPAGAPAIVAANASDSDGGIVSVQFFADNQLIGEDSIAPYSVTWTPENKTDTAVAVLTALATDNFGITTLSEPVTITVTGAGGGAGNTVGLPPSVSLTSPAADARLVVGQAVTLTALANDTDGNVLSVQFFANGQSLGSDNSFPYSVTWTPISLGNYAVVAKGLDNDGNATSSTIAVSVIANSGGLPQVSLLSPLNGSKGTVGAPIALAATALDSDGVIQSVEFSVNGLSVGRTTQFPHVVAWVPTTPGVYSVTAAATDTGGNRVVSSVAAVTVAAPVGNIPLATVSFNNPGVDASTTVFDSGLNPVGVSYGSKLLIGALAVDDDGSIVSVEFFLNGRLLSKVTAAPYFVVTPLDTLQDAIITAVVTDNSGNVTYAMPKVIDTLPSTQAGSLAITLASPTTGRTYSVGSQIVFAASHNAGNQPPPKVDFYVNGQLFHTVLGEPFTYQVGLTQPGAYDIHAVVRAGTATSVSAPVRIFVTPGTAPSVSVTAPSNGSTIRLGNSVNLRATASDADGTIKSVQFYVNGTLLGGPDFDSPYTSSYTPPAEGIYRFTALATDSSDQFSISSPITVMVTGQTSTASSDAVYVGNYFAGAELGRISVVNTGGKTAVAIAHSSSGSPKTYFYQGLTVDLANGFSLSNASGAAVISGRFSDTGATGTFDGTRATFISPVTFGGASGSLPAGLYSGNVGSKLASTVTAILGNDGSLFVHVVDGSASDAGSGFITSSGTFSFTLASGARIAGSIDLTTRFLTAVLTGGPVTGTILAAPATGGNFSDGALRNLSTRGQVGAGDRVLVAGFVVAGTSPKKVLIRGIGPSLGSFGITGGVANPELLLFRGSSLIERNDNWGGNAAIVAAAVQVGAFALNASSLDAAILTILAPGTYTAQVNGISGGTGLGLVEIYDVDALDPFTSQKVMNISTRGEVGTGDRLLLAGFVVSGSSPKKVLVRAIGPSLASFGVTGTLADPILRITQGTTVVRENDNWETGNNVALVLESSSKAGAFALPAGSRDAVILLTLPPGTYNAQVTGVGTTTGVALVEVYEVP